MARYAEIVGLWITRPYEPDTPELLAAWDSLSVDGNPEGVTEDFDRALAAVEGDYDAKAVIRIQVDLDEIMQVLKPAGTIAGKVVR